MTWLTRGSCSSVIRASYRRSGSRRFDSSLGLNGQLTLNTGHRQMSHVFYLGSSTKCRTGLWAWHVHVVQRNNAIITDGNGVMCSLERWHAICLAMGERTTKNVVPGRNRNYDFRNTGWMLWSLSYRNPWWVRSLITPMPSVIIALSRWISCPFAHCQTTSTSRAHHTIPIFNNCT